MANKNFTPESTTVDRIAHSNDWGFSLIGYEETVGPSPEYFVIGLNDSDGRLISGTEFSEKFACIGDAFDALPRFLTPNKNVGVFCRPVLAPLIASTIAKN